MASSTSSSSSLPPSIMTHTLITAPLTVVYNTLFFTTAGVVTGATISVYRAIPAIETAFVTGRNTGAFAFSFFGIREYLVHPLLSSFALREFPPNPATPSSRTDNLLSTSIAGLTSGTLFSYFTRGVMKGSVRAGATLGLGCVVVQAMVNEGSLGRIRMLAWSEERARILKEIDSADLLASDTDSKAIPTYTRDISTATPNVPSRETFSERSDRLIGSSFNSFKRGLERISPVKKMEEGEYEKALKEKLEGVERERDEVRRELEELRK